MCMYLCSEQVNPLCNLHQLVFGRLAASVGLLQDFAKLLFLSRHQRTASLQQDDLFFQLIGQLDFIFQLHLMLFNLEHIVFKN